MDTYAYCMNERCRLYKQAQYIPQAGVVYEEGRLATKCRCSGPLVQLTEGDLRELREMRTRTKEVER